MPRMARVNGLGAIFDIPLADGFRARLPLVPAVPIPIGAVATALSLPLIQRVARAAALGTLAAAAVAAGDRVVIPALGVGDTRRRRVAVAAVLFLPVLALAVGHTLRPEVVGAGDDADDRCDVDEVAHDLDEEMEMGVLERQKEEI